MADIIDRLSFSDIEKPALRDFFSTWLNIYVDEPRYWGNFQPEQFGQHVRHMDESRYNRTEDRFQSRFVGSCTVQSSGVDTTGKFLDQLPNFQSSLKRFKSLVETKRPYFVSGVGGLYDVLVCPLFDEAGTVTGVISRTDFGS